MTESKIEVALNTLYANINAQNFCILTTVGSYGSFTPHPAPNNIKTEWSGEKAARLCKRNE